MKPPNPPGYFILDANVLIDYCKTDRSILTLVAKHLGDVYVPQPVLDEVKDVDAMNLPAMGIKIVLPETEALIEAASHRGPLSFEDRICLILAGNYGWTCVTNDGRLRKECQAQGIGVIWGLEPMALLVEQGQLSADAALEVALAIQKANPRFITAGIVGRFRTRIGLP